MSILATKDHPSNLESNHPSSIMQEQDTMKNDESFEFFSEEWLKNNNDSNFFPNEDILFCGNFIFSKQPISKDAQEVRYENTKVDINSGSRRDSRHYAKLMSMNKGRNYGGEHETKRVFPASASMKSRWYNYYGFRLAGVPAEMDLGTMRSRQNRHRKTHSVGAKDGDEKMDNNGGLRQGKGLSRLIRDLSCDGQTQVNSMVKASLVCIPRV